MSEEHRAVIRGAKFLDKIRPGWYREVKLSSLSMNDCHQCILGQIYGEYTRGLFTLGFWGSATCHVLGFAFTDSPTKIARLWKTQIRIRRGK